MVWLLFATTFLKTLNENIFLFCLFMGHANNFACLRQLRFVAPPPPLSLPLNKKKSLGNIFEDGLIQNLLKGPKISLKCEPIPLDHASQSRETICCLSNFFPLTSPATCSPGIFAAAFFYITYCSSFFSGRFSCEQPGPGTFGPD